MDATMADEQTIENTYYEQTAHVMRSGNCRSWATQASYCNKSRRRRKPNKLVVENKMGLPPPYEQTRPNPAPPPSYFGDNPPPPPGFTMPTTAPRTTVITTPATGQGSGRPAKMGPGPTGTTCTTCNKTIVTRVEYVPNNRTHIISAALCVLAGCCCGCFVPYCMRSCKTANHYCPQCKAFIGSYTPS